MDGMGRRYFTILRKKTSIICENRERRTCFGPCLPGSWFSDFLLHTLPGLLSRTFPTEFRRVFIRNQIEIPRRSTGKGESSFGIRLCGSPVEGRARCLLDSAASFRRKSDEFSLWEKCRNPSDLVREWPLSSKSASRNVRDADERA